MRQTMQLRIMKMKNGTLNNRFSSTDYDSLKVEIKFRWINSIKNASCGNDICFFFIYQIFFDEDKMRAKFSQQHRLLRVTGFKYFQYYTSDV